MRVLCGHGKVRLFGEILAHVVQRIVPVLLPALFAVPPVRQHVGRQGKEEQRRAAEQEIGRRRPVHQQRVNAVDHRENAYNAHRRARDAERGLDVVHNALLLCGSGENIGKGGALFQIDLCLRQLVNGLSGLRAKLLEIALCLLGFGVGKLALGFGRVGGDAGMLLLDKRQQAIHVCLKAEAALLLLAVAVLHHQIRKRAEDALAGIRTRAHGHALEYALDLSPGDVEAAVDVICAHIQRLFADAAGSELAAGFSVGRQNLRRQCPAADGGGLKDHDGIPPEFNCGMIISKRSVIEKSCHPQRNERTGSFFASLKTIKG